MRVEKFGRDGGDLLVEVLYSAPPKTVWRVLTDPALLARWWGAPEWPATFHNFELEPGGHAHYVLTGPEGEQSLGWWKFEQVDFPRLIYVDGFSDPNGEPNLFLPTSRTVIDLFDRDGDTLVSQLCEYESSQFLAEGLAVGLDEAYVQSAQQIAQLLVEIESTHE